VVGGVGLTITRQEKSEIMFFGVEVEHELRERNFVQLPKQLLALCKGQADAAG